MQQRGLNFSSIVSVTLKWGSA